MKKITFIISFLFISFFSHQANSQITFRGCTTVLGGQDFILVGTGTINDAGTIRNTFESSPSNFTQSCPAGVCEIQIKWNIGASRWEVKLDNDGPVVTPDYTTACLYYNTTASFPNPPDLTLGSWVDCSGGNCPVGQFVTFSGDVQSSVSSCTEPDVPTALSASPSTICPSSTSTLTWTGALNDATLWHIYTGSCGGNQVGTTATNSFTTAVLTANTTFYIRGEDGAGCVDEASGSCGQVTVTVQDVSPPTAVSQNITAFLENNGTVSIPASDLDGGSTDNCGAVNFSASTTNFTCADEGPNTVTLTVSDGNGNSSITTASITVVDTISPIAATQNITAFLDGAGTVSITASDIDGGSSDNCGIQNLSASGTVFTCADIGTNNVTLTVTDVNGNNNYNNATSVVTVVDTISPVAATQNITAYLENSGTVSIAASDLDNGSSDNCGTVNFSASGTTFTCEDLGPNTVTLSVDDGNGNTNYNNSTAYVTVIDTISPVGVTQNITAFLDGAGTVSITASDIDGGSSDNCGIQNLSASGTVFTCADIGPNNVTLTVTDASGNTNTNYSNVVTSTSVVTVVDTISPVAVTQNINAYLENNGTVSIAASDLDNGSSDNCGTVNFSASGTIFTCADLGPNTVTLTVDDGNGNINYNNSTAYVTVIDTISPTAATQNITAFLDGAGTVSITASDLDNGSSDNCGTVNFSASGTTFTCADLGPNTITLTVDDGNGNTNYNNSTAVVTVMDTISPTVVAQNIDVYLDIVGNGSISASDIDGGSSDNCGTTNFSASGTTFTCADVGPNNVTLTVDDGNGNTSTAISVVTVNAYGDASFNYSAAVYCANASDPTPTITGTAGGTFTALPSGLIIDSNSGEIDVSNSIPGIYTVTYITPGICPSSLDVSVTISALPAVTFTILADIALDAGVQTGINGGGTPTGGIFSGPGVTDSADGMTYDFDPAVAGAGTHTLTYTVTVGGCSDSATDTVEVFALESIAITEWISNPNGTSESEGEWIELYNYGATPIDIQNWRVKDEDANNSIITNTSFVVPAGGFVILARDKTQIETKWFEGCSIDNVLQTSFGLANGSDEIIIENAAGNIVWSVAYKNDDTSGRATHYTEVPNFTNRFWGSKASTGVDRSGNDPATGTLGYEKHNVTANPLAVTSSTGDIGSPLNGTQTTIIDQTVSVSPTSGACSVDAVVSIASSQIGVDYVLRDNLDDSNIEGPIAGTGAQINFTSETLTASKTYNVYASATGTCSIEMSDTASVIFTATIDDASFTFPSEASQCDPDQTPNITGLAGGTFSSTSGLIINTLTGEVDNSASTAGAYIITYSLSGPCPNSSSVNFTIAPLFDASFTYDSSTYCLDTTDPTPTITGIAGGVFSSTPGLILNTSTGEIDVSNSTPGIYTVSYGGFCYNTENTSVTINAPDNASFNYNAAVYCQSDLDPTPTITGLAGGTFTSTAGLTLNSGTGAIDVSASIPGTYSVTYSTVGSCANNSSVVVTVNSLDDASFASADFCESSTNTISGVATPGGVFSIFNQTGSGLAIINNVTGILSNFVAGDQITIEYTTPSVGCANASTQVVNVSALDDASFTSADFCESSTNTISGIATPGGVFSILSQTGSGLAIINNGTGILSSFVAGDQITIQYTTPFGGCENASTQVVNVSALDDASFNYSTTSYCINDSNPTPTITGLAGGMFSSSAGLFINASTGLIDIAASTNGTYTVTYTTSGSCSSNSSVSITIDECTPNNDDCSNATPLTIGVTLTGESTAGATDNSTGATDDTDCQPSTFKSDVWYTFQAPLTGLATVTTVISGTSDQANVAVYSSLNCSQLDVDLIACSAGNGGESINLTGLTASATYYVRVWSDGAVIRNVQLTEGTFNITVTETTLSTTDLETNGFTYYPNPVKNILTLKSENTISQISVLNMLGQVVLRETANSTINHLDFSNLQSGAYFVEVIMEGTNRTKTIRVIKE